MLPFSVDDVVAAIMAFAVMGVAMEVALATFTVGIGNAVYSVLKVVIALLAAYLLNRVGSPLIANATLALQRQHSYVKMRSNLIFWDNSFSTLN
ncbi:MAG: hypothetical protein LBU60_00210 [Clostridiales bacterium]|nr:hypothetical protein [Clostridiales bacterium]